MALEYSTKSIEKTNTLFEGSCEQTVDCDISLPDYCPDISRVLKCCVTPCIASAKISGDRACADGNIHMRVIYADEDNNICTYEQNFPFSKFIQLGADISGTLSTQANVQYTNFRAVNKKRIELHSSVYISFRISAVKTYESIDEISKKSVQVKKEKVNCSNLCAHECKQFSVSETVELPHDYQPAERVISCCASPIINDVRAVQDKLLIKGEVDVTLIYCSDNNHGESVKFNHTIPINQVIDVQGINENSTPEVRLKLYGCECNVRNDTSSTPRIVEINCNIIAHVNAYCNTEIDCITDAYSTEGQLKANYEQREIMNLCDKIHETSVQKFNIDLSSLDGQKICCLWWDLPKVNKTLHDGTLGLHCVVPLNIIAVDSDNRPVFCEREVDFEFRKTVDSHGDCIENESIVPLGFLWGNMADSRSEIKGEFLIDADVFSLQTLNTLVDADLISTDSKPATCIIVYFPDKEESIWNIARKFNTTVDMIKEQNSFSGDCVETDKPLLIPVI